MKLSRDARLFPLAVVIALVAIALVSASPQRVLAAAPTISNVHPRAEGDRSDWAGWRFPLARR